MRMRAFFQVAVWVLFLSGGYADAFWLKRLTPQQGQQDLAELVALVEDYYGPLKFKEERFGIKVAALQASAAAEISKATSDDEIYGALAKFLAAFQDGHVDIEFPGHSTVPNNYKIPIFLTPIEGKAIVASVESTAASFGLAEGDEVETIDGIPAMDLVKTIVKYKSLGNADSNAHLLARALNRPSHMTELRPKNDRAIIKGKKIDGTPFTIKPQWNVESVFDKRPEFAGDRLKGGLYFHGADDLNQISKGSLLTMGGTDPFFVTKQSTEKFRITKVSANADYLKKYEITDATQIPIFASLHRYDGKMILTVRQPTYQQAAAKIPEYIKHYKALLDQYEPLADVLVVDQTHNPGGNTDFEEGFFRLFTKENVPTLVQFMRADRKWIRLFELAAKTADPTLKNETARDMLYRASEVEEAQERGEFLTPLPLSLSATDESGPHADYRWKKPVLVLIDELAGSCGDIFPMLMKRNKLGTLFGKHTMGLGGSVETVGELTHSGAKVNLTRGLFTSYRADGKYEKKDFVENDGIEPDHKHEHTIADFRAGFVGYVEAFSKVAVKLEAK